MGSIPDHFIDFLSNLTESGRYGSASEAIRAALRLLEQEEAKVEALQNALIEGGESHETFDDIVNAAIDEYKAYMND